MEVSNATPFALGFALGPGPEESPVLGVIVKGTFTLPREAHGSVTIADEQLAISTSDQHYGDDVEASVRIESDLVPCKRRTDIVLVGMAHAPGHRATPSVDVSLRVGSLTRRLRVFGDRFWDFSGVVGSRASITRPEPFVRLPLVYERAFGGIDSSGGAWCAENLVGTGFVAAETGADAHGTPVPNIEDPGRPITSLKDRPFPAGFGFFGKGWQPRVGWMGSVDGMREPGPVFGLPRDFSLDFYNGAHPSLQTRGYLDGYEDVELTNLTEDGHRHFHLPGITPEIRVVYGDGGTVPSVDPAAEHLRLDTLVFLPEEERFYQVWRGAVPVPEMEEDLERIEVIQVDVGVL